MSIESQTQREFNGTFKGYSLDEIIESLHVIRTGLRTNRGFDAVEKHLSPGSLGVVRSTDRLFDISPKLILLADYYRENSDNCDQVIERFNSDGQN